MMKKILLALILTTMLPPVLAQSQNATPDVIQTPYDTFDALGMPLTSTRTALEKMNFATVKQQAEQGDKVAQFYLAKFYDTSVHTPVDHAKAFEWYEKSANQGYANAQNNLATYYSQGKVVRVNKAKAIELWTQAAQQNHLTAMVNLGIALLTEDNPNSHKQGLAWLIRADKHGFAIGSFVLASIYQYGIGVEKDEKRHLDYLTRASELGYALAQYELSKLHQLNTFTTLDHDLRVKHIKQAHKWATRACLNGVKHACSLKSYYDTYPYVFTDADVARQRMNDVKTQCQNNQEDREACNLLLDMWQKHIDTLTK